MKTFSDFDLVTFSDRVAKGFSDAGFQVLRIEMPKPVVTILQTPSSGEKKSEIIAKLAFPTYLNSFLANGKAYVPVYQQWASSDLNQKAVAAFESAGYEVHTVNSDYLILLGGTVHCMTREVH